MSQETAGEPLAPGDVLERGPDGKLYRARKRQDAQPVPEVDRVTRDDGGEKVERTG